MTFSNVEAKFSQGWTLALKIMNILALYIILKISSKLLENEPFLKRPCTPRALSSLPYLCLYCALVALLSDNLNSSM